MTRSLSHRWGRVMAVMLAIHAIHVYALMSTIPTGCVTELAANTFFFVNARDDFVIKIEMLPFLHAGNGQSLKIRNSCKAFFAHPVGEAVGHVFDNAIAVMHHGRANLDVAST